MSPTETHALRRMQHARGRVRLDPTEALIFKYECEALTITSGPRFQPAVEMIQLQHTYYTPLGDVRSTSQTFCKQNTRFIYNYIRDQLRQNKIHLTNKQIDWYLNRVISPIFEAAEVRFGRVPFGVPKYSGVTFDKARRRWKAQKRVGAKVKNLGWYDSPERAYQAVMETRLN